MEHWKTGGGTFQKSVDATEEKVLGILKHRAVPYANEYDDDRSYHSDIVGKRQMLYRYEFFVKSEIVFSV